MSAIAILRPRDDFLPSGGSDTLRAASSENSEHSTGYRNSDVWEILVIRIDLDGTLKLTSFDFLWIQRYIDAIGRTIAMCRVLS